MENILLKLFYKSKGLANEILFRLDSYFKTVPFLIQNWFYSKKKILPAIHELKSSQKLSIVDQFWGKVTVTAPIFFSTRQSINFIEWRFAEYPLFKELSGLYGNHEDDVILDYGCGPGNDVIGFGIFTHARKIIAMDVSKRALQLTQNRAALHRISPARINLFQIADMNEKLSLESQSVDFINCQGVLHHISHPEKILREFYRILKPGGCACVMVYNYDSIFVHLYIAYIKMIIEGGFSGMNLIEAFSKNTDGASCPISRCYRPEKFIELCRQAGFDKVLFKGGYFSKKAELDLYGNYLKKAIDDSRLAVEQKKFLESLTEDDNHFPLFQGKYAGHGGVFHLKK